jgi:putative flippase GtrA
MKLVLLYSLFAVISTIANICTQDIAIRLYRLDYAITFSVFAGTIVGLVVKYLLDKNFIFRYQTNNIVHDSTLFVLYTLMGVATTAIFWGFEFTFEYLYETKTMRYLGAVIGLSIGYWIKYHLDKRFVFKPEIK